MGRVAGVERIDPGLDEGVYVVDADAAIVHVDAAGLRLLGYDSLSELRGRNAHTTLHGDAPDAPPRAVGRGRTVHRSISEHFVRRDGSRLTAAYTAIALPVGDGTGCTVLFHPTAASPRNDDAVARLRRAEALRQTLVGNIPDTAVFILDRELRFLVADGEAKDRLPWLAEAADANMRVTDLERVPPDILAEAVAHYRAALQGERRAFEVALEGLVFAIQAVPLYGEGREAEAAIVVLRDVTQWATDRAALAERARQQEMIAELGRFALQASDHRELIEHTLASVVETLGARGGAVLEVGEGERHLTVTACIGLDGIVEAGERVAYDPTASPSAHAMQTGRPFMVDPHTPRPPFAHYGRFAELELESALIVPLMSHEQAFGTIALHDRAERTFTPDDATFLMAVATLMAVAVEREREEAAVRHAALHDPLTGLPNRALAVDRLQQALAWREREGVDVAVLMMDLDHFKHINDSYGHGAGDEALVKLAPQLRVVMRPGDTLARVGGDEFVVICPGADAEAAVQVAERLAIAASRPLSLRGGEHFFSISTGIAVAADAEDTADSLLRDADAALYRAKDRGRGRYELFDAGLRSRVVTRMRTERELRRALQGNELAVWYQPVIDLATGRPVATEALVRWQHPVRGVISPGEFIPIAEETGLILTLGLTVLEAACRQTALWQQDDGPLAVSVNVSGHQVVSPGFAAQAAAIVDASGLVPGTLTLEITETVLMTAAEAPVETLTELRDLGMTLAIDDFGTGYSSLARLKAFPLDALKVDRAFVSGMATGTEERALMKAMIDMAHTLGMRVVAEGVETSEQLEALRDLGCDRVQGYLYTPPRPADEVTELLAALRTAAPR